MEVKCIGVVGAGQMGSGIAQVAAQAGYEVILNDVSDPMLERGRDTIAKSLARLNKKELLTDEAVAHIKKNVRYTTDLNSIRDCDFVVEAIIENESLKVELIKKLDAFLPNEACIASNTSSIPITRLAASTSRPTQFMGMHFMNPVPVILKGRL